MGGALYNGSVNTQNKYGNSDLVQNIHNVAPGQDPEWIWDPNTVGLQVSNLSVSPAYCRGKRKP